MFHNPPLRNYALVRADLVLVPPDRRLSEETPDREKVKGCTDLSFHNHILLTRWRSKYFVYHFQRYVCCLRNNVRRPKICQKARTPKNSKGQPSKLISETVTTETSC